MHGVRYPPPSHLWLGLGEVCHALPELRLPMRAAAIATAWTTLKMRLTWIEAFSRPCHMSRPKARRFLTRPMKPSVAALRRLQKTPLHTGPSTSMRFLTVRASAGLTRSFMRLQAMR